MKLMQAPMQTMTQGIRFMSQNFLSLQPKQLDLLIDSLVSNPEKTEDILRKQKHEKKSGVRNIYELFAKQGSGKAEAGFITDADIGTLGTMVSLDYLSSPDVTYTGQENDKPKIVFSESLAPKAELSQALVPKQYTHARRLCNLLLREREWINDTLRKMYGLIGERQREFMYSLSPKDLHQFDLQDLAGLLQLHYTTITRLRIGKYVEVIGKEKKTVLPANFLLPNQHKFREYNEIEGMNRLLGEEAETGLVYSDEALCENLKSARRTITKYRAKYGIPGKRERNRAYEQDPSKRFQIELVVDTKKI
jgi:hypothetical protein